MQSAINAFNYILFGSHFESYRLIAFSSDRIVSLYDHVIAIECEHIRLHSIASIAFDFRRNEGQENNFQFNKLFSHDVSHFGCFPTESVLSGYLMRNCRHSHIELHTLRSTQLGPVCATSL